MKIKGICKNIFIIILTVVITFLATSPAVFAANKAAIKQKRRATNAKIKKLKILEGLEKNKLYKNQQKLEHPS